MLINKYKNFIFIAAEVVLMILLVLSFIYIRGCVNAKKDSAKSKECSKEGETVQLECPKGESGRKFEVCKDGRYEQTFSDCKSACGKTVFEPALAELITQKCVSCHTGFDAFNVAKTKIDEMIRRIGLDPANPQRMPKGGQPLSKDDQAIFSNWKKDGLLEQCETNNENTNPHLDLDYIEGAIEKDLDSLTTADQAQARYLLTTHKSNEKANLDILKRFENAVNKSMNSLSFSRDIVLAQPIDQYRTVFRVFLRDLKLNDKDWNLLEAADQLDFESFSNRGVVIKQLTKTRKPWLLVDSVSFFGMLAPTYYAVRKLPANTYDLFKQLGVDFNGELANLTALHVGFSNSPIALNKNRLIGRWDSNDGEIYITFDVDLNHLGAEQNLFNFPLLKSASGKADYKPFASEFIFSLPSQLHGYYLATADGVRQDKAPISVVKDNASPFSPEIESANSCFRCHLGGQIHAKDEVKAHVDENAALFNLDDVDFVDELYRDPEPYFNNDNSKYAAALSRMGISVNDADPVSLASDDIRRNLNADAVAAFLFITKQELLDGLNRSAEGRQQVGSLLVGGEITSTQFIAALPVLKRDLRLFQNPFP